jgi:hypothetical protein
VLVQLSAIYSEDGSTLQIASSRFGSQGASKARNESNAQETDPVDESQGDEEADKSVHG